ncbi:MAG: outer membrane protein transport protein [Gammaproteobacteria bacterium]|nr:outer membrane protein transport protein [Gammaproteobacteria bacterium]
MKTRRIFSSFPATICLLIVPSLVGATNGLNQIGFGTESVAMGGADIAVARDTSALNTNPAGLVQIKGALADVNSAIGYTGNITHKDAYGNDTQNVNRFPLLGNLGYAQRLDDLPLTLGIGLFAQGGTGNQYDNLRTAFGTVDDLSATLRLARISPGVAWQVNDALAVGVSLIGTYGDLEQELFPNTSYLDLADPSRSFFGYELSEMRDTGSGIKLGVMYEVNYRVKLGAAYNNRIDLEFEGEATVDLSALGLGKVNYRDARVRNLDQPQELGIGAAIQARDDLLVSLELNWIDWSSAINGTTLTASAPDNALAPATLRVTDPNHWRDQYVVGIGFAYDLDSQTVLRAGYNYGRNPIPEASLSPLLNTITEHHLAFGFGRELDAAWRIDGAFVWDIKASTRYNNPGLPFGDSEAVGDLFALHFRVSRAW